MNGLRIFSLLIVFNAALLICGGGAWAQGSGSRSAGAALSSYYAKSYAVVVGIGSYPSSKWSDLSYARKDAEGMASILQRQGFEVITLYDGQATREKIISVFEDNLAPRLKKNDRVLVFFSGHGDTQTLAGRDYGYLVPHNAGKNYGSLISMETLRSLSDKMGSAKHHLFILDACFGGLFAPMKSRVAGIDRAHPRYVKEITRRTARQFLTAGGKGQQVLDGGPNGYSYFTGYLLDALGKGLGDLDGDGYITLSELASYLVPKATNEYQTPGMGTLPGHGLGEFLFRSPSSAGVVSATPAQSVPQNVALGLKSRNGKAQQETLFWQSIKDSKSAGDFRAYLQAFPNGLFAGLARNRIGQLQPKRTKSPPIGKVARLPLPDHEVVKPVAKQTSFGDYFAANPNEVLQDLSLYLQNNVTYIGAPLEVTEVWEHRTAKKSFPNGAKSGTWTWINFDVRLSRDETANREGYFLIEIRGKKMVVHAARGLTF